MRSRVRAFGSFPLQQYRWAAKMLVPKLTQEKIKEAFDAFADQKAVFEIRCACCCRIAGSRPCGNSVCELWRPQRANANPTSHPSTPAGRSIRIEHNSGLRQ